MRTVVNVVFTIGHVFCWIKDIAATKAPSDFLLGLNALGVMVRFF
jgi:hypothetical protein